MFVDANNLAKALTFRTGTYWRVKREQVVGRLFKRHTVGLELRREIVADVRGKEHQSALAIAFVESRLG